jgi:hypothetical protein
MLGCSHRLRLGDAPKQQRQHSSSANHYVLVPTFYMPPWPAVGQWERARQSVISTRDAIASYLLHLHLHLHLHPNPA